MSDPAQELGDTLRLVGGPRDGQELRASEYRDRWHVPCPPDIGLGFDRRTEPIPPPVGVYEARRDPSSGRRSRADDGAVLLDWQGWR